MLSIQYIECSALTQKNLKTAFDSALLSGLDHRQKYIPRPIHLTNRISPTARLRKSMRRLSILTSRKKLTRHRDSADSDSSLTSSASSSSSMLSDSSLSDSPSTGSSTYSKTFDPERMESQLSIKSQLRSMITCFGWPTEYTFLLTRVRQTYLPNLLRRRAITQETSHPFKNPKDIVNCKSWHKYKNQPFTCVLFFASTPFNFSFYC